MVWLRFQNLDQFCIDVLYIHSQVFKTPFRIRYTGFAHKMSLKSLKTPDARLSVVQSICIHMLTSQTNEVSEVQTVIVITMINTKLVLHDNAESQSRILLHAQINLNSDYFTHTCTHASIYCVPRKINQEKPRNSWNHLQGSDSNWRSTLLQGLVLLWRS